MLRKLVRLLVCGLIWAAAAAPLQPVGAAPAAGLGFAPNTPAGGTVGTGPGTCSEGALTSALAGGGTVTFNCGGPATILILSQKTITQATTIDGGGLITITGGLATRLFDVNDGVPFTLRSITLDSANSGAADGGAISSGGTLTLDRVTIQNSETDENHSGGAIFTTGPVTITNSSLHHNSGGNAGAIFAYGSNAVLRIADSTVASNQATNGVVLNGGQGGALWVGPSASATLINGLWVLNTAEGNGGAVYNESRLTLQGVTIASNQTALEVNPANGGKGGGIATIGPLTMTHSYLTSNKSRYGGGLFVGEAPRLCWRRSMTRPSSSTGSSNQAAACTPAPTRPCCSSARR